LSATANLDGLIYAIGGMQLTTDGSDTFASRRVDVYSPQQDRWWTSRPTLIAHVLAAAATGRHRVYVIGGITGEGEDTARVESRPSSCFACR
jgi:hypothetical protein